MTRLYESLDQAATFAWACGMIKDSDEGQKRAKAAIARYIAGMSLREYIECRRDWRKYADAR